MLEAEEKEQFKVQELDNGCWPDRHHCCVCRNSSCAHAEVQARKGLRDLLPDSWELNVTGKCSLQTEYSFVAFVLESIELFHLHFKTKSKHTFLYVYSKRTHTRLVNSSCSLVWPGKEGL